MTPCYLPPENVKDAVTWEVNGESPSMSPQAIMQAANQLLAILQGPLGPVSGLQVHALVAAIVQNGPMRNLKGVQLSQDELRQQGIGGAGGPLGPMGVPDGAASAGVLGAPAAPGGANATQLAVAGLLSHLQATGQAGNPGPAAG